MICDVTFFSILFMIYDIDYDLKREATKYSWRQWHGNSSGLS